jgi:hypothetical protein
MGKFRYGDLLNLTIFNFYTLSCSIWNNNKLFEVQQEYGFIKNQFTTGREVGENKEHTTIFNLVCMHKV